MQGDTGNVYELSVTSNENKNKLLVLDLLTKLIKIVFSDKKIALK